VSNVRPVAILSSISMTASASTWMSVKFISRDSGTSWKMMIFVGLLTAVVVFMASAEMQKTVRTWIRHRSEHRLASAKGYEIRRRSRSATTGPRWTQISAAKIRKDAVDYGQDNTSLAEIMRITRSGDDESD
jgi:hypothetical protein